MPKRTKKEEWTGPKGWTGPSGGAGYCGVGKKQPYDWLKMGLRHVRLPNGRILIKFSWIDEFLLQFEAKNEVTQAAEELVDGL